MPIKDIYKLSFSLYCIISIFTFLIYGALPAILAANHIPPQEIGLLYMAFIPFVLGFFYSGFMESYRKKHQNNFKKVYRFCSFAIAALFVVIAFLDPNDNLYLTLIVFFFMSFLSASVLICLNGVAVEETSLAQKHTINTIMLVSSGIGGCLGIIGALFIYEYYGWFITHLCLGGIVLICALLAFNCNGNPRINLASKDSVLKAIKNKTLWKYMGILICFVLPLMLCASMSSALLVYIGLPLQVVGLLSGVLNCVACLVASPLVLGLIRALGFKKALLLTLIFESCLMLLMVCNMQIWQNHFIIFITLFLNGLCFGAQFVFMYSLGMHWCEKSSQCGVDFSLLRISENLGFVAAGIIASQIIGAFAGAQTLENLNTEQMGANSAYSELSFGGILSSIFTHSGVDKALANGYSVVFCLGAIICVASIFIVLRNKSIS
ncbi:MFS transporter [Helicobacter marmotae]|uniref:MFS transporter n=1 Tax=Helicobacter marmotae TaxID=152490 RepID=A0A3D8I730_9HELI|nr:MFS transporter [Helicobacter marmotae]RDU60962.1 MFS transporter [Helicobacter marmotae]